MLQPVYRRFHVKPKSFSTVRIPKINRIINKLNSTGKKILGNTAKYSFWGPSPR